MFKNTKMKGENCNSFLWPKLPIELLFNVNKNDLYVNNQSIIYNFITSSNLSY